MNLQFNKLIRPTSTIVDTLNRWENDPALIPMTRPNKTKAELERRGYMSLDDLTKRLENHHMYLIYMNDRLIGEMNYMVDPPHLYKKEPETAWIGITIGETEGRGKGIGSIALHYLENQIKQQGHSRIELGVFEFNIQAQKLYEKLGYQTIGVISDFTYWQERMWSDIRMDKFLETK